MNLQKKTEKWKTVIPTTETKEKRKPREPPKKRKKKRKEIVISLETTEYFDDQNH